MTEFRLCKEFGWTVEQLNRQPAKKILEFLVVLGEMDRQTKEEMDKAKAQTGLPRGFQG